LQAWGVIGEAKSVACETFIVVAHQRLKFVDLVYWCSVSGGHANVSEGHLLSRWLPAHMNFQSGMLAGAPSAHLPPCPKKQTFSAYLEAAPVVLRFQTEVEDIAAAVMLNHRPETYPS
jgi:hypothetical protein